jgi:hypothetical protein
MGWQHETVLPPSQPPAAMNTGSPSTSSAMPELLAATNSIEFLAIVGRDPARQLENSENFELDRQASIPHRAAPSARRAATAPTTPTSAGAPSRGRNTCTTPSSDICCSASFSFFAFIASVRRTRRTISGAKLGTPTKVEILALGQRIADPQRAVVRNADDVAGEGLVGHRAVLGEEELRLVQRSCSCRSAPAWPSCRARACPSTAGHETRCGRDGSGPCWPGS